MIGTLTVHEGDEFEDNGSIIRMIRIDGRHFDCIRAAVFVPSEDGEEWVAEGTAIFTKEEVARIAGARRVVFAADSDEEDKTCRGRRTTAAT